MENLTLVDPYLNTDAAVGGRSFSKTIVDVRTQGLQRNGALVVMLGACDFRAAQTAAAGNLDALGAMRIARPMDCFIARRKPMRFSS